MVKKILFKTFITIIGLPILVIGIILIPLPGPGLLVTLLGLFILSFAYDSVKVHLEKYKKELMKIINKAKEKQKDINKKIDGKK